MYNQIARALERGASLLHGAAVRVKWRGIAHELNAIPELAALYARYHASPEGKWTIGTDDLVNLYQFVRTHERTNILELGMGVGLSTASMALALKHSGGRGHITALEQTTKCIPIARELLPSELAPFVTMVEAPPHAFHIPGVSRYHYYCGYDWTPPPGTRFDMVFLDGPTGWLEEGMLVSPDNADLYHFLPYLAPGCLIYVDGRRGSVKMVERYLGQYLEVIERDSEYTVLRVKVPVATLRDIQIHDTKLEPLKGIVYFPK
ncbi:MAG TPA: hypothetical protein VJK73_02255 [Candidatus Paceibacterota bacterium]